MVNWAPIAANEFVQARLKHGQWHQPLSIGIRSAMSDSDRRAISRPRTRSTSWHSCVCVRVGAHHWSPQPGTYLSDPCRDSAAVTCWHTIAFARAAVHSLPVHWPGEPPSPFSCPSFVFSLSPSGLPLCALFELSVHSCACLLHTWPGARTRFASPRRAHFDSLIE